MAVVGHLLRKASEVELVLDVRLVDLAEELVAAQAAEPGDPRNFLGAAHGRRLWCWWYVCARYLVRVFG